MTSRLFQEQEELQREYNRRMSKGLSCWQQVYNHINSDKNAFEKNKIWERSGMFNEDEVKFIKETAERDIKSVNSKIENHVNEMARIGKQIGDLKVVQSHLQSIIQAIQEEYDYEEKQAKCC